jgi:hypothetical protein
LVQDASDIPRAGRVLADRLWLNGHGYCEISKSGQILERTSIDTSVWQTSRLDFAGGAECAPPLKQQRGSPVLVDGSVKVLDTRDVLPNLTPDEQSRLQAIKSAAKAKVADEAHRVRAKWIAERRGEMLSGADASDPARVAQVDETLRVALDHSVLTGDFVVRLSHNGRVEAVSVATVLKEREKYHGAATLDPVEPDYDGGRATGKLYLLQSKPTLHSFAHGGAAYHLQTQPVRIEVVAGRMPDVVDSTTSLLKTDPMVFDFGQKLAMVADGRLRVLDEDSTAYHLGGGIQYFVIKPGQGRRPQDCNPPKMLLKQLLSLGDRRALKPIDGVITGPTIRPDGSVLSVQGYDAATRLFLELQGGEGVTIPDTPSRDDAQEALSVLMFAFRDFPFVTAGARGGLLAALLSAAVRPTLETCPAFGFDAPVQGSGKTLLAQCVGALAEGDAPEIWPHTKSRDDEETRKRLFASCAGGRRVLIWDNITGVFDSASLAGFITAPVYTDRVLGKSETQRLPNRTLLLLTGNNLVLSGDLPRRVVVCRIDPGIEAPTTREFELKPMQHVLLNRSAMLGAACVLIRYQLTTGKKWGLGSTASFEAWDALVRQTVCMVDAKFAPGEFGDPAELLREAQVADPECETLHQLLDALRLKYGTSWFTAKDVCGAFDYSVSLMTDAKAIREALADLVGDKTSISTKSMGRLLKFREGRIVFGLRLVGRHDGSRNGRMYRVEIVEEQPMNSNPAKPSNDEEGL